MPTKIVLSVPIGKDSLGGWSRDGCRYYAKIQAHTVSSHVLRTGYYLEVPSQRIDLQRRVRPDGLSKVGYTGSTDLPSASSLPVCCSGSKHPHHPHRTSPQSPQHPSRHSSLVPIVLRSLTHYRQLGCFSDQIGVFSCTYLPRKTVSNCLSISNGSSPSIRFANLPLPMPEPLFGGLGSGLLDSLVIL